MLKKVEEEKIKLKMRKKSTTKDASSKRDNYYTKRKNNYTTYYISTSVSYAAQHRFKLEV